MCILFNIIIYCMGEVDFMILFLKVFLFNFFSDLMFGLFINGFVIFLGMGFYY